ERRTLEKQFNLVEKGGAATKAVLEKTLQEIVDRKKRVEEARQERKELEETLDRVEWLDQKFVPVLENVEEEVLGVINREFDAQLRKWVNVLLEGAELEARVDASFTPQITQDNYEQDVNALSGGEKTAIALAYRLALNELTRREYGSLKENLLILDEPTDGFSREQLQKMRAVFDSINGQVIVVSHERELEAFVDKVFHVVKNGASEVVA
ncbi:DNA repair protein Rad50, partial [Candidatus Micrarchaeota archaeon CG10_big_fil_rev_8_21_14_0_10_54_18]